MNERPNDRRLLRSNGRVAHLSLRGQVSAERFVEGTPHQVCTRVAAVLDRPDGAREREVLFGQDFIVLERDAGHAFGYCARDGYVGYVSLASLAPRQGQATHVVHVRQSYAKTAPDLKARNEVMELCHGSRVTRRAQQGDWACADLPSPEGAARLYIPAMHLAPVAMPARDPVEVAQLYLGTPYLWGGNSSLGIDCSGLVQAACLACGIACPADSDMQEAALGQPLNPEALHARGDLLFWKGHVAMAVDATRMIHANAHHMAVAVEPIDQAVRRIADAGGGPVTSRKRLGVLT